MPRPERPQLMAASCALCLGLSCAALPSCGLADLAAGQLALINEQIPLARAVAHERDPERRALLAEVPRILAFAEDIVGLRVGHSYSGYYETEQKGLTYVVTACAQTEFEPYTWWFPIAGEVEYRSYWDESDALAQAGQLEADGYDTWVSPSRAYSSLGILRDPISTTMLRDGLPSFVDVLIHELSHAKLYVPGHTDWNEALASFVGERGAERYFDAPRFAGTDLREQMQARARKKVAFDRAVNEAYMKLERLYTSQQARSQKLRARERVFSALTRELSMLFPSDDTVQWRMNNARLVHFHRYSANSGSLAELWAASGQNFRRFWRLATQYSRELD